MMSGITVSYHRTGIGELILGTYEEQVCLLDFRYRKMRQAVDNRLQKGLGADFIEGNNALLECLIHQIDEYLAGRRRQFDLPLLMVGTDFQKRVWQGLMNIDYGDTRSYLALARQIDCEHAVRAVAAANGANAMSLAIPCHRVIGSNGELVGYGGGLPVKRRLLNLEGVKLETSKQLELI